MATVGLVIPVPYNEFESESGKVTRKVKEGKVIQAGECTTALVQSRASKIFTFLSEYEHSSDKYLQSFLYVIQLSKKQDPKQEILINYPNGNDALKKDVDFFITNINELIKSFQLVLVEVEVEGKTANFWYLLKNCDPQSLSVYIREDDGEVFWNHPIPLYQVEQNKEENSWYYDHYEFHEECTQLEASIPGILTTIANWTKYGMLATGIRRFGVIEDLLRSPYVNRPELIPYFIQQYKQDYNNFVKMAKPSTQPLRLYRASFGYNTFNHNFNAPTILATTTDYEEACSFAKQNENKIKVFQITPPFPIVNLRGFNPHEKEILLVPPVSFTRVGERVYNAKTKKNGGKRSKKQKQKRKTRRRH